VNAVAYLRNARKGKAYRRGGGAFVLVHAKHTNTCWTVATKLLSSSLPATSNPIKK
jgi:hypothetical protein